MKLSFLTASLAIVLLCGCEKTGPVVSLLSKLDPAQGLSGQAAYLASPFAAAGDRLYLIGNQDGSFPDLGWHVTGEMGGIWDHPIKLMDGFSAAVVMGGDTLCLNQAKEFVNYPMANQHRYSFLEKKLEVERVQFVPDGKEAVIVEFTVWNGNEQPQSLDFIFEGMTDLSPVWLGERTGMTDAPDSVYWQEKTGTWVGKDTQNPWFVSWGANLPAASHTAPGTICPYPHAGKGTSAQTVYSLKVEAGKSAVLRFCIAGSWKSEALAAATQQTCLQDALVLFDQKQQRYATLAATGKVTVPDSALNLALEWSRYNTDWLIRDVEGTGRGLSAGLPDYPWWFGCDNEYALRGVLASGRSDIVLATLDLLRKLSEKENGNGRIVHEVSTNGSVFNPGNLNETPQFAPLVWAAYCWTGDRKMLEANFPIVQKGLVWLMKNHDPDGNGVPDGFGMMEIHGLNSEMIDVASYTWQAYEAAAHMADELGEKSLAADYRNRADKLAQTINSAFWAEKFDSYADFMGTAAQAQTLIEDAIVRADTLKKPWAVAELRQTLGAVSALPKDKRQAFVVHHNWVVNTPMEVGVADSAKALRALATGSQFVNPFGMFVTGIDRDETAGNDVGSFASTKKIFSYVGAVMTLPTGVQAIAENNYGRPDAALGYLQRMVRSFGYALPGSMYEVSPDFGMMTQAWTVYSLYHPVVGQFFGVEPFAFRKQIELHPQMPTTWNEASIEALPVGDNAVSVHYERTPKGIALEVSQQLADWELVIQFPKGKYRSWKVDGKTVAPTSSGNMDQVVIRALAARIEVGV